MGFIKDLKPNNPLIDTLLFTSTCLFSSPDPGALGILTTLGFLLQQNQSESCTRLRLFIKGLSAPAIGNMISTFPLFHDLIEGTGNDNIGWTKFARDIGVGVVYVSVIGIHQSILKIGLAKNGWQAATSFGFVWAFLWELWTKGAALGQLVSHNIYTIDTQGVPTPLPADFPALSRIARYSGHTGINLFTGTSVHLFVTLAVTMYPKSQPAFAKIWNYALSKISDLIEKARGNRVSRLSEEEASNADHEDYYSSRGSRIREDVENVVADDPLKGNIVPVARRRYDLVIRTWGPSSTFLAMVLAAILAILMSYPLPPLSSLSGPIESTTPVSIACILPPSNPAPVTAKAMKNATARLGSAAQILVWPENVLSFPFEEDDEKYVIINETHVNIARQYGVWVVMSMQYFRSDGYETYPVSASVLVDPEGIQGWHEKPQPTSSKLLN